MLFVEREVMVEVEYGEVALHWQDWQDGPVQPGDDGVQLSVFSHTFWRGLPCCHFPATCGVQLSVFSRTFWRGLPCCLFSAT